MEENEKNPPLKKLKKTKQHPPNDGNDGNAEHEENIKRAKRDGEECVYNVKFALYKDTQFGNYLVPFVGSNLNMTPKEWADSKWVLDPPDTSFKWVWEGVTPKEMQEFEEFSKEISENRERP